ncbi:MAG TPA: HEAT repeat domain-containing protein [Cyclobacteriaceae bacterium]|nr:HEAT repeat domain-containing protein [Cyclobacteriaceae bacterium]
MNKNQIEELIAKYNEGLADPSEILHLELLIESGEVDLTRLRELAKFDESLDKFKEPIASKNLDQKFYDMLLKETSKSKRFDYSSWFTLDSWIPKLSVSLVLIVMGFIGGTLLQKNSGGDEVKILANEVSGLKEMMMISMLEKESATDRLKAVSLSEEIQGPSKKVTEALFKTLNSDPSVNVRLAALDALHNYAKSPAVREGLVRSIAQQDSPLVQVALAELMVSMQEKSSVKELKKILEQKSTPKEVKQRIEESIKVLI